jgi:glucokinase
LVFHGISKLLAEHIPNADSGNPLFERIRHARNQLSPAERRVANWVLENPRAVLNDPVVATSRKAEVSQPTVIRFCRSLGFEGLADFKLKLASGLTGSIRLQRTHVKRQDAMADMCAKVLDNTMSSIANFRELVNVEAVERAIALLRDASRVELFAVGDSAIVALDAQEKLLRFRMPVAARTDPHSFGIATESLHAKDVALIISSTGQSPEVVRAATSAKARGASVITITASRSPLAKKADVCIDVDHDEDSPTFVAMISRILHLLVVDLLAVGLAVRRLPEDGPIRPSPHDPSKPGGGAPPGVWISHIR